MTYTEKMYYELNVNGVLCVLVGVAKLFEGVVFEVISLVLLIVLIVNLVRVIRKPAQSADEMADTNLTQAKAVVVDAFSKIACIVLILFEILVFLMPNWNLQISANWITGILFAAMGIKDLCTGIVFRRLEAE